MSLRKLAQGTAGFTGADLEKMCIRDRDEPIKAYGSYQVKAKLGFEVSGTVYVTVCEEK